MILKKQISYIFTFCFILACAQNIDAMRCKFKAFTWGRKAQHSKELPFCSKSETSTDDSKKLQRMYASLETIAPDCFNALAMDNAYACKYENSCCLLAKKDAEKAKEGKAVRLQDVLIDHDDIMAIVLLKQTVKRLTDLQEKNAIAQTIFLESQDKQAITELHKNFCELTKNISECLTYGANIYGTTFYDCSARYYEKNPKGLFDSTKHMTQREHKRSKLQDECNKINKQLMKSIGYPLNQNILLGWGAHTMDPECIGAFLGAMERLMREHDEYKRNGGGVY